MNKKYRDIIVNHIKYSWLYKDKTYKYNISEVLLFKIDTVYDLVSNTKLERRRYLKTFEIDDKLKVTPEVVKRLILNGKVDNQFIRKMKLRQIDRQS